MRVSVWSSDVCSSDLLAGRAGLGGCRQRDDRAATARTRTGTDEVDLAAGAAQIRAAALLGVDLAGEIDFERRVDRHQLVELREYRGVVRVRGCAHAHGLVAVRSEEHTSELQSLMRISYA